MVDIVAHIVESFGKDLSPGRMFESVTLLAIIWSKLRPHLTKIETRLLGVEAAVKEGTQKDNERFEKIEGRIKLIEERTLEGDST